MILTPIDNDEWKVLLNKKECLMIYEQANEILEENDEVLNYDKECILLTETLASIKNKFFRIEKKSELVNQLINDFKEQFINKSNETLFFEEIMDELKDGDKVLIKYGKIGEGRYEKWCRSFGDKRTLEELAKWEKPFEAKVRVYYDGYGHYNISFDSLVDHRDDNYFSFGFNVGGHGYRKYKGNNLFFDEYDYFLIKVEKWII